MKGTPKSSSVPKRTFRSALIEMFEKDYKILGSHRVLEMIADDICQLRDEFYPSQDDRTYGSLAWVTTSAENAKPRLGQRVEDYKNHRILLPLIHQDDVDALQRHTEVAERDRMKIVRLAKEAFKQDGMLTVEELSLMLNRSEAHIIRRIREHQERAQEILPLKGNRLDIGSGTTHKRIVIELYEQKMAPPEIAARVKHNQESVDRYIKDYDRVKFLARRGVDEDEMALITGRGKIVIRQYVRLVKKHHPEIFQREPGEGSGLRPPPSPGDRPDSMR